MATGRHRLRLTAPQKIAVALSAVLLAIGLPLSVLALTTSPASAAVPTGDDYPYRSMPCERAPYAVAGYCTGYDWGPVRNGAESTTYTREYGYGYRNCTDFVAWRLDKVNGYKVSRGLGNASTWGTRAGYNHTPAPGAVAWFGTANHVAWVESVNGNTVVLQDYNHGRTGAFSRYAVAASTVPGFIHFKDISGGTTAPPAPTPPASNQPVFTVMNTSETPPDGVWFRDNPNASGPRLNGYGVYSGDRVQLTCYGWGQAIGASGNRLWYYSANLTRPHAPGRANVGWLNAHFVDDGQNANAVVPGVRAC